MLDEKLSQKWDEEADIVIVGSGFAGLAAAIEAKGAGSSVIILEKMKGYGIGPDFASYVAFPYGIMVNPKTGYRFVNELADRKIRSDAILQVGQPCIGIAIDCLVFGRIAGRNAAA